jgi:glutamyl-tRNA synthetase
LKESSGFNDETLTRLLPVIKERIHTQKEVTDAAQAGEYDFAFIRPEVPTDLIKWKNDSSAQDAGPRLLRAIELLKNADWTSSETIKAALWNYAEEVGRGELLWPLRVSLTGKERSPDPFIVSYIIGREEAILRVENAYAKIIEKSS